MTGTADLDDTPVTVIGSALIDDIHRAAGLEWFLGGTGFNLAIALAQEGIRSTLVASVGRDRAGQALASALVSCGVDLLVAPDTPDTRHAATYLTDGEPRYQFDSTHRRVALTTELIATLRASRAVAVNSFPFDSDEEVRRLGELLRSVSGLRIVDPNPRPGLLRDAQRFARNLEGLLEDVDIVKISHGDLAVLDRSVAQMLSGAVQIAFVTKGPDGAEVVTKNGMRYCAPAAPSTAPLADTIGAGDAALASLLAGALSELSFARSTVNGDTSTLDLSDLDWQAHLTRAMAAAAECCRQAGGPAHIRVQ